MSSMSKMIVVLCFPIQKNYTYDSNYKHPDIFPDEEKLVYLKYLTVDILGKAGVSFSRKIALSSGSNSISTSVIKIKVKVAG